MERTAVPLNLSGKLVGNFNAHSNIKEKKNIDKSNRKIIIINKEMRF